MADNLKAKEKLSRSEGFSLLRRWRRLARRRAPPSNFVGGIAGAALCPLSVSILDRQNVFLSEIYVYLIVAGISPPYSEDIIFYALIGAGALVGIFVQKQLRKLRPSSTFGE